MTVKELIAKLTKLTNENPDLAESYVVFHLPTNASEGELCVAEYDSDNDTWENEAYIGLPDFVKGPMD